MDSSFLLYREYMQSYAVGKIILYQDTNYSVPPVSECEYCMRHADYKNERAVRTIDYLIDKYDEHFKNNTFLGGKAQ